jgi:hypothetical protein
MEAIMIVRLSNLLQERPLPVTVPVIELDVAWQPRSMVELD